MANYNLWIFRAHGIQTIYISLHSGTYHQKHKVHQWPSWCCGWPDHEASGQALHWRYGQMRCRQLSFNKRKAATENFGSRRITLFCSQHQPVWGSTPADVLHGSSKRREDLERACDEIPLCLVETDLASGDSMKKVWRADQNFIRMRLRALFVITPVGRIARCDSWCVKNQEFTRCIAAILCSYLRCWFYWSFSCLLLLSFLENEWIAEWEKTLLDHFVGKALKTSWTLFSRQWF